MLGKSPQFNAALLPIQRSIRIGKLQWKVESVLRQAEWPVWLCCKIGNSKRLMIDIGERNYKNTGPAETR